MGAGSKVLNKTDENENEIEEMITNSSLIGIAFAAFWGLFNIFKTHREEKFIVDMDESRVSASDFTLMITHFPGQFLRYETY